MKRTLYFIIALSICISIQALSIDQLSIQGFAFRSSGNFMVYYPRDNMTTVRVFNQLTKEDILIPGSENSFGRVTVYPAIASDGQTTIVTWCSENRYIFYSMKKQGQNWTQGAVIFEDQVEGLDTNRSSLAIDITGNVMVVCQRDYKIDSRMIYYDGSLGQAQTVVAKISDSEATRPVVKYHGGKFYAAYTCECGVGNPLERQTVAVSVWDGNWTSLHTFTIAGSPDSLDMAINRDGTIFIIATEYCDNYREYCKILLLTNDGGKWGEYVLFEQNKLGDSVAGEHQQPQPLNSIAISPNNDIMIAWPFNSVQDNDLRIQTRIKGVWSSPEVVAGRGYSALSCDANGVFSLYCLNEGSIQLRQYNLNPTPTPTITPKPTMTATAMPTSTPTKKPGHSWFPGCATTASASIEYEDSNESVNSNFLLSIFIPIALVIGMWKVRRKWSKL